VAEQYADLFERIRDHCRQQGWYGPDMQAPAKFANRYERSFSLKTGQMYVRDRWADPRTSRFPYPPATADQLQATETQLGMPLPGVLRALYAMVGNGGFGPAYGLVGAAGGAPSADVMPDEDEEMFAVLLNSSDYSAPTADADPVGTFARDTLTQDNPAPGRPREESPSSHREERPQRPGNDRTLAATFRHSQWRLPERAALALAQEADRYLECEEQPDGWVTLCHWNAPSSRTWICGQGASTSPTRCIATMWWSKTHARLDPRIAPWGWRTRRHPLRTGSTGGSAASSTKATRAD